jgi:hypothetical protein
VCERLVREPYPAGHSFQFGTDYRATQLLWPQEDQDEPIETGDKGQLELHYRVLVFMNIQPGPSKMATK